jgi:hypothetical protein
MQTFSFCPRNTSSIIPQIQGTHPDAGRYYCQKASKMEKAWIVSLPRAGLGPHALEDLGFSWNPKIYGSAAPL